MSDFGCASKDVDNAAGSTTMYGCMQSGSRARVRALHSSSGRGGCFRRRTLSMFCRL